MQRASARFAALLVVTYIGIGLPIGALGVAWPQIRETFDQPLAALGVLLLTFTAGNILTSVVHGRVAPRFGTGPVVVAAEVAGLAGLLVFAFTPVWAGLLVGMALLGVAVAGLDAELNSYVAVHHGPRLLNLMHAGFGIGATIGPLAIAALLGTDLSWRVVYVGMAMVWLVVAVAFVLRRHHWVAHPVVFVDARGIEEPADPVASRHLGLTVLLGLALFFVLSGVELGVGSWGFTLLTSEGSADGAAGLVITFYWGALTLGRLLLGAVGDRVAPLVVMHASVVVTAAASTLLLMGGTVAAIGMILVGFGQAGIFPSMVALTPSRLGHRRSHRVMGLQFAAANLGGALLPALIGVVAERRGETAIAVAVCALAMVLAGIHVALVAWTDRGARRLVTPDVAT